MRFNLFRQSDIPEKYRSNFRNLYLDIAWFGVLSGTAINFVNVYATRLGASGLQIGLLTATSAVVSLFLAIPAGHWISKRKTGQAVFWSSIAFRIGYFLWIPLPWLFDAQGQIWALISLTFLMAIPLTPLGVGFNALFAEAVPDRFRASVAGTRNITFAIAYMLTSLISGYLLKAMPFPGGYQVVFAIGAIGAAMSSYHIYRIRPVKDDSTPLPALPQPIDQTQGKPDPETKATPPRRGIAVILRLDIWKTHFRMSCWHCSFFILCITCPTPSIRSSTCAFSTSTTAISATAWRFIIYPSCSHPRNWDVS
jgi:MFS family permease